MTEASEESVTTTQETKQRTKAEIQQEYINTMCLSGESYNRAISIKKSAEDMVAKEQKKLDDLYDKYAALNKEMADHKPTPEELLAEANAKKEVTKQYQQSMAQ